MEIVQITLDSPLGREAAALRMAVFVEEQGVPPDMEMDAYDPVAAHFVAVKNGGVVGTLRIVDYLHDGHRTAKIGRVAVARHLRGQGIGRDLMHAALRYARHKHFPACYLTAQIQVVGFYEKLGFIPHGPVFDDCGIPHRAMTLTLGATP